MPYDHITAFGTSRGNLTDDERLRSSIGMQQSANAAQLQALQAEIADRQAGRTFQAGEGDKTRAFEGGMFDKNAGLQRDLDTSATNRALGVVDRQMQPSLMDAQLRTREANVDLPVREARGQAQLLALKQALARMGGAPGAAAPARTTLNSPGFGDATTAPSASPMQADLGKADVHGASSPSPATPVASPSAAAPSGGLDDESMMFLAFGGNPGELAGIRRQEMQARQSRQDAIDNRSFTMATEMLKSDNPAARALGASIMAKSGASGVGGTDPVALQSALRPQQSAADAIAKSASLSQKIDELTKLVGDAGSSWNTEDALSTIKEKTAALVAEMQEKGVSAEDASGFIKSEIDRRHPRPGWLRPLSALEQWVAPDHTSEVLARRAVGLLR